MMLMLLTRASVNVSERIIWVGACVCVLATTETLGARFSKDQGLQIAVIAAQWCLLLFLILSVLLGEYFFCFKDILAKIHFELSETLVMFLIALTGCYTYVNFISLPLFLRWYFQAYQLSICKNTHVLNFANSGLSPTPLSCLVLQFFYQWWLC